MLLLSPIDHLSLQIDPNPVFVYEMFNKTKKLETFLPKTLYNFVIVCYNVQWEGLCAIALQIR